MYNFVQFFFVSGHHERELVENIFYFYLIHKPRAKKRQKDQKQTKDFHTESQIRATQIKKRVEGEPFIHKRKQNTKRNIMIH